MEGSQNSQDSNRTVIIVTSADDDESEDVRTNVEDTLDYFLDEETWDRIGKDFKDFDEEDMKLISLNSLDHCYEFYQVYAKVKGFGIRKLGATKSRGNNEPVAQTLVCSKQGFRKEAWLNMKNRKKNAKRLKRTGCNASIKFKLDKATQRWNIVRFNGEHNHDMVHAQHIPYIRYDLQLTI